MRHLRKEMQIIFQDLFPEPSQERGAHVGEPPHVHGMTNRREREGRSAELLEVVGLKREHMRRYPHQFSGGQRQRIGVARALALNPKLIICDEAVSALDVSIQAQVINLLEDLQDEFGLTYLFISHALSVVQHISDRVAVMYLGKIVETAESGSLYREPLHPYSQALLQPPLFLIPGENGNALFCPAMCRARSAPLQDVAFTPGACTRSKSAGSKNRCFGK
jgi:ABC-type oligopeptide transport system ATPase subunit